MITFEMLSINLYEFIKMNNFQGFSLNLIKRFAIQILIALFFMKEHNIVHCDMKPENILLRKINKSGIKIIDFGSGCFENEKIYTYIQSRFYRAPEIVLGIPYTTAIDMWSYGCILYELFVGYPLFPGEDEKEHMAMIMEVKGVPPRSVLARATRRKVFFDDDYQPILVPNSRGKLRNPSTKSLVALMNCPDRDFVDFVDVRLAWIPNCVEMHRVEGGEPTNARAGVLAPVHREGRAGAEGHPRVERDAVEAERLEPAAGAPAASKR